MERERHGFVTFWLWLMIIINPIMAISCFAGNDFLLVLYNYNRTLLTITGFCCIVNFIAVILLLNWINGFWLLLGVAIITPFVNSGIGFVSQIIGSAIGCLIQFGILHLKKNDISTWTYLTNNNDRQENRNTYSKIESFNYSLADKEVGKCPFCAEEIKSEAIVCRFCGKDIKAYDNEIKLKEEEMRKEKEQKLKEKYKNIEDIFNDNDFMEEARTLRRFYGKSVYINKIKKKAEELGFGNIEINENDIE